MKYVESNGQHIAATQQKFFQGNLIFASPHCFNLLAHSRRDDLISLSYLLLYIIDGDLTFLSKDSDAPMDTADDTQFNQAEFKRIRELKNSMTPKMLCESIEAQTLLPFIEEVFSYKFEQEPDYQKLKNALLLCLKNENGKLDNIYDWNEEYEMNRLKKGGAPRMKEYGMIPPSNMQNMILSKKEDL